jgi:hypothetical protein
MEQYATYSPEDNKLRLYIGRVPRDEYLKLKSQGWKALFKQREAGGGDFVATWTPERRNTALTYSDIIYDEDMGPEERAADRAERFAGYRDKRQDEAIGHADRYESQPTAHGFQSEKRAEKAAARHDRIGTRATDAWDKAEYWTRRTAAVISHALYKSRPDVRMGRIKVLESDLRAAEKTQEQYASHFLRVQEIAADPEGAITAIAATRAYGGDANRAKKDLIDIIAGYGKHAHPCNPEAPHAYYFEHQKGENPPSLADYAAHYLSTHHAPDSEGWETTSISTTIRHLKLRIAYENQMLEAQGGRAGNLEMIPGGFLGSRQIQKVNKSSKTGRVVSVLVQDNKPSFTNHYGNPFPDGIGRILSHTIEVERLAADVYRPPTEEELAEFLAKRKAAKAAAPKAETIPLINPTDEDAQRLQSLWNSHEKEEWEESEIRRHGRCDGEFKPSTILRTTQATYSANSKGSYCAAGTRQVFPGGHECGLHYTSLDKGRSKYGQEVCQVRRTRGDGGDGHYHVPSRVIILTDKPQKPLHSAVWDAVKTPSLQLVTA